MHTYLKTITVGSGTDGVLVLEPREGCYRKTNFPNNWLVARIGFFFSFTSTGSDNAAPTAEGMTVITPLNDFAVGFIRDPAHVAYADSSSRFVGVGMEANGSGPGLFATSTTWAICRGDGYQAASGWCSSYGNGTTQTRGTNTDLGTTFIPKFTDPASSTLSVGFFCAHINVNSATGVLATQITGQSNVTDPSDSKLAYYMENNTYSTPGNATGGFWDLSSNPINCPYVYIRAPFYNSRLRIHNILVKNLT